MRPVTAAPAGARGWPRTVYRMWHGLAWAPARRCGLRGVFLFARMRGRVNDSAVGETGGRAVPGAGYAQGGVKGW